MVLGDPYDFSIILDVVDKWNQKDSYSFYNGILTFCIGGIAFPHEMVNATLGCEVPNLVDQFSQVPVNKKLFDMKKEKAFLEIYHNIYQEDIDIDNDYSYDMTPYCFGDNDCYVFAVSDGQRVRFLASVLEYRQEEGMHGLDNIEVAEAYISVDDMAELISKLKTQLQIFINENRRFDTK